MRGWRAAAVVPIAALLGNLAQAAPDPVRQSLAAVRVATPPVIDGKLDDAAWAVLPPDDRFVQEEPLEKQAPTERTELRVTYDDVALYVAFECHDSDPGAVVARPTRRDRDVESDWVSFIVDSRDDRSTAYAFRVNAAGVQHDAIYYNDGDSSTDWDAVWSSAVRLHDGGWSAEFRIPLSVLRFPARDKQSWGFQAARYISRKKELAYWQYVDRNAQGFVSLAGRLEGLTHLAPKRTFELRPYAAARISAASDSGGALLGYSSTTPTRSDASTDFGVDIKLGLNSDLTLDGTINPDFGQVEADQVVLNLTRFETFFPEKRPFFLESLDLFQMPVLVFYTRRIGQPSSGLVPGDPFTLEDGRTFTVLRTSGSLRILGAAKLTGKISNRLQVGLIAALTDPEEVGASASRTDAEDFELTPRRGYAVGRLRYDFGDSSYLGAMATAVTRFDGTVRRADADHDAFTQVIDGIWRITKEWKVTVELLLSERAGGPRFEDAEGVACDAAGGARGCRPITRDDGTRQQPGDVGFGAFVLSQTNIGKLFIRGQLWSYSPELDLNDIGFLPQYNIHRVHVIGGIVDNKPKGIFQTYSLLPGGIASLSYDGVLRDAEAFFFMDALFKNYIYASAEPTINFGGRDILETFDGARFEKLRYLGTSLSLDTDSRRAVVLHNAAFGYFADDGSFEVGARTSLGLQVIPQLELTLEPEVGHARYLRFYDCVAAGGAACTIDDRQRTYRFARQETSFLSFTLRGMWTFSPTLSLNAYAQLFLDRGKWSDYRAIDTDGLHPTILRSALVPIPYTGDLDGDGVKDDDFQDVALNINIVVRWEFLPGSTVIGVFTRAQTGSVNLAGHAPRLSVSGLQDGPTEDVLLLKLVYFIG